MYRLLLLLVQEEAHGPAGAPASPFEVNSGLFFWTWIVFGLLLLALWKLAFPAILRATEERERRIQKQLEEAEQRNTEARTAAEEHQRLLAGARDQALALINEAKTVSQQEREAMLHRTREEQEQLLERARREIQAERERAVALLRQEAVDLSLAAASRLIEEKVDDEANRKLVTQFLNTMGSRKH
jgi:F-type H+-transporting ATPase subunit b